VILGIVWQTRHSLLYTVINVKCPQLLSSLSADCTTEFVRSPRKYGRGRAVDGVVSSIADCARACVNTRNCLGFEFDKSLKQPCSVYHPMEYLIILQDSDNGENYKLTERCTQMSYYGSMYPFILYRRCNTQFRGTWGCACVGLIYPKLHR